MEFVAHSTDDQTIRYVDRKRYLWLIALLSPLVPVFTVVLYFVSGANVWVLFVPLLYVLVWVPVVDGVIGEDTHNPPDAVVSLLAGDNYYRTLLYIDIGLFYAAFIVVAWFVGTHTVPWWAYIALALGTALSSVHGVFVRHELGHKKSKLDRVAAQAALALVAYGHFTIEHNRGHHVHVATPEDSASARMGESVYRFAIREIPGALTRAWRLEKQRLAQQGRSVWSLHNEILQSWLLSVLIAGALVMAFGLAIAPFIVIHHLYAWYGLTQANYVEHYGLLREKLPNGRYELPQPKHSWNTNHIYSNLLTFHLQRHSDHHANASRPYQALRDFAHLPRLPSGYPGCFGLAMIPSLWFNVMDAKLLQWCGGDLSKVNIDPQHRVALYAKYGVSALALKPADALVPEVSFADAPVLDLAASGEFVAFEPGGQHIPAPAERGVSTS